MTKTALLKNSTAVDVVQSPKLPATKPKREYADFDAFVANADNLVYFVASVYQAIERLVFDDRFEWIEWPDHHSVDLDRAKQDIASAKYAVDAAHGALARLPWARKHLAEFKREAKWYDRKELYEIKGKGKRAEWTLSRRVVSEQIALLLASFQNSRPGTPKAFGKMVVEEVYANNPNACVLESACRRVRREKDFPPSIAEVLKAIKSEGSAWCDRWELEESDADYMQDQLQTAIAEAESTIAKAEAKLVEREAKAKAAEEERREKRERERQKRLAREQRERERKDREAQERQIELHVLFMRRSAETRFLWRYFYLLMLANGILSIFIDDRQLVALGRRAKRERWEREWKAQDAAKAAAQRVQARAHCRRLRPRGNGALALRATPPPISAAAED